MNSAVRGEEERRRDRGQSGWAPRLEYPLSVVSYELDWPAIVCVCLSPGPLEKGQVRNEALRELRVELSKKHRAGELDGFTLYL